MTFKTDKQIKKWLNDFDYCGCIQCVNGARRVFGFKKNVKKTKAVKK